MSRLEETFAFQVQAAGLPEPEREYRFHPVRRWSMDFAWPQQMVAVEVEGAVYTRGRHTRGRGFTADCEKYAEAALLGWTVLRFTRQQIESGYALECAEKALAADRSGGTHDIPATK